MINMGLNDSIKGASLKVINGPQEFTANNGLSLVVGHHTSVGEILEIIENELDIQQIKNEGLPLCWYTMKTPLGLTTY